MIKKIYYNTQLVSSFLLDKTRFIFILFLILLNGNTFFSLVYCEDHIENLTENGIPQEKKTNNNFYLYFGFALVVGIAIIIYYYTGNGGDGTDQSSLFSNDTPTSSNSSKSTTFSGDHFSEDHTPKMEIQNLPNNLPNSYEALRMDYFQLERYSESLLENQESAYRFLEKMMALDPNTSQAISKFLENHPKIPPRIF